MIAAVAVQNRFGALEESAEDELDHRIRELEAEIQWVENAAEASLETSAGAGHGRERGGEGWQMAKSGAKIWRRAKSGKADQRPEDGRMSFGKGDETK